MLKKRIIPILLSKGDILIKDKNFNHNRCIGSVLPIIKIYNMRQVDELIFLDIIATNNNKEPDYNIIKEISKFCFVPLTVGGGIKNIEQIRNLLKSGADKVSINSAAYIDHQFIKDAISIFGSQCIIISVDVKKINNQYICFSHSGTIMTQYTLIEWLNIIKNWNIGELLITSIDNDGLMIGYDIELINITKNIIDIPIIISGGCSSYNDMLKVFEETDISAVGASSIFQFTQMTPNGAKEYLKKNKINVRKIFE